MSISSRQHRHPRQHRQHRANRQVPAAGLVVAVALVLAACSQAASGAVSPQGGGPTGSGGVPVGTLLDRPLDPAVLALPLTDERGRTTSLKGLSGKTVVLTDFLTTCAEICPMTTADIHAAAVKAPDVVFLEVSVDPGRDDVRRLAAYDALYGKEPNWHVLTAGAGTANLWRELGVYYKRVPSDSPPPTDWLTGKPLTYDVDHQDAVFVLDAAGHERWITQGTPVIAKGSLPAPMASFLDDQGRSNLASPDGPTWTAADVLAAAGAVAGRRAGS